ncbi:urease accessory protein [Wenyingzhuangia heitensis]|uniref:Urease accessory protein UreD n=1 Tax=Wenyingzhuangia heitensis TaxID=1487859 RepID=A0ABX0UAV6_9FLAO|nr:urease accessory protein UreD [Wenyingzhuangia heitensis]NIJ45957.1 urease accessory protein [Wenyingzhuangia heitensis]
MSLQTQIVLKNIYGITKATTIRNQKPIKILSPKSHKTNCHLTTTNYGGGFVQGDYVKINIKANADTTCVLTSQANNRVYKSENGKTCSIYQEIELKNNTHFFLLNDPLVLQKDSKLNQYLSCKMAQNSYFVLLDWVSVGRVQSNENLEFDSFYSEAQVVYNGKKILLDKFSLRPKENDCTSPGILANHTTFINLYIIGETHKCLLILEHCKNVIQQWLQTESKPQPTFVVSADTINPNLHILRASATETLILWRFVKEISTILTKKELLDFNPYERKY